MIFIIIWVGVMVAVNELITASVYGSIVSDSDYETHIDELLKKVLPEHSDQSLLFLNSGIVYISKVPFSLLSRYYVRSIGQVPRWSNMHKKIEAKYLEVKNNKNEIN